MHNNAYNRLEWTGVMLIDILLLSPLFLAAVALKSY